MNEMEARQILKDMVGVLEKHHMLCSELTMVLHPMKGMDESKFTKLAYRGNTTTVDNVHSFENKKLKNQ